MTTSGITNINAKLIHQHPDNPRKDLGDLSELSESIKKKGIMQNLTVIPGYWDENRAHHDEGYTLIIGHRRFAAGKMAGVTMYPWNNNRYVRGRLLCGTRSEFQRGSY